MKTALEALAEYHTASEAAKKGAERAANESREFMSGLLARRRAWNGHTQDFALGIAHMFRESDVKVSDEECVDMAREMVRPDSVTLYVEGTVMGVPAMCRRPDSGKFVIQVLGVDGFWLYASPTTTLTLAAHHARLERQSGASQ